MSSFLKKLINKIYPSPSVSSFTGRMKAAVVSLIVVYIYYIARTCYFEWQRDDVVTIILRSVAFILIIFLCLRKNAYGYVMGLFGGIGLSVGAIFEFLAVQQDTFYPQSQYDAFKIYEGVGIAPPILMAIIFYRAVCEMDLPPDFFRKFKPSRW